MPDSAPGERFDPKQVFRQLARSPYARLAQLLRQHPEVSISGSVTRTSNHYVHEKSTQLDVTADSDVPSELQDEVGVLLNEVEEDMWEWAYDFNRKCTKQLYAQLEYFTGAEGLTEEMNANEWRFDEDGDRIDLDDYVSFDELEPRIQQRVLARYAAVSEKTPEQLKIALAASGTRFSVKGVPLGSRTALKASQSCLQTFRRWSLRVTAAFSSRTTAGWRWRSRA